MKSRIALGLIMGSVLLAVFSVLPQHHAYMFQTNTGNNLFPAWSPDGRYIAYASDADGNFDIWRLDVSNLEKVNLTQAMVDGAYSEPAWSPDGEYIAFTSNTEIWVIESDGSNPTKLELPAIDYVYSPQWSPDGIYIAFLSYDIQLGSNVWIYNRENSTTTNLTGFENPLITITLPRWSPDGTRIAFSLSDNSQPIEQIGPKIGVVDIHIHEVMLTSKYSYASPNWSPDGENLITVLIDSESSDTSIIYIVEVDPDTLQIESYLTDEDFARSLVIGGPVWSFDSRQILFKHRGTEYGDHDLWVMSADGSDLHPLTDFDSGATSTSVWSPDSKQVAFELYTDSGSDIWLINVDGSNPINLTGQE